MTDTNRLRIIETKEQIQRSIERIDTILQTTYPEYDWDCGNTKITNALSNLWGAYYALDTIAAFLKE